MIEASIGILKKGEFEYSKLFSTLAQAKEYLAEAHKKGEIEFLDDYFIEIELTANYFSEHATFIWDGSNWIANIGK